MCGIIGYIGKENRALEVIIEGLEKLEYRGYDSAGIAYISENKLEIIKEKGKIINLKNKLNLKTKSNLGIGHTRWATHGEPNYINSHPHKVGKMTIVHNGIIENYSKLQYDLIKEGYKFKSQTDTEVACALLDHIYKETNSIEQTLSLFKEKATGAYALGIICDDFEDHLFAVKKDSPLIIALNDGENYIASDVPAILKFTNKYIILDDGDFAKISADKVIVFDKNCDIIKKKINIYDAKDAVIGKNGYEHYMLKEIFEEPEVIKNTFSNYIENSIDSLLEKMPKLENYERIDIVGCGSAYHAGLVGKTILEKYTNIPVNVEVASEYRYKDLFLNNKVLVILISQSGETADTLAACKVANESGATTLGIINVLDSSIARASQNVVYTKAGREVAVATTKAYIAQVMILVLLTLSIGLNKKTINENDAKEIISLIKILPTNIQSILNDYDLYKKIAKNLYKSDSALFIGRNIDYALAMEGSLKLKEVSYINSQCYPAGELKHGTISLIDDKMPVIAIVTDEKIAEKTISNIKECKSRGAIVTLVITEDLDLKDKFYDYKIVIPKTEKILQSLLTIVPLQILSYEVAKYRKCDIDQPKNLAKSVTVE